MMRRTTTATFTFAGILLLASISPAQSPGTKPVPQIVFEPSKASTVVEGTVRPDASSPRLPYDIDTSGSETYSLSGQDGQILAMTITSDNGQARFSIEKPYHPGGNFEFLASRATRWSGKLTESGNYIVIVYTRQNESRFKLDLRLTPVQAPPIRSPPAEDTARYVEWLNKRGIQTGDKPHERTDLRVGGWGFFYHGERPPGSFSPPLDRVALDRSGHAVTEAESSDWYAFLSTEGLDAKGALDRIGWLFNAGALYPTSSRG